MKHDEIREANRRALPKYLVLMAVFLIAGFILGFLASRYGLGALGDVLHGAGEGFGMYVAPWIMLAIAVVMPIACGILYRGAKKLIDTWDGEDEEVYQTVDGRLSLAMWIAGAALIATGFLTAASYSRFSDRFESLYLTALFLIAVVSLFAIVLEMTVVQQKCVDAVKRINPEKKASVYDLKFQKKWMDDCDEAEKILIGKCAYKAYAATNKMCAVLSSVLSVSALLFDIGFLPSLAVFLIWTVNQSAYCGEAVRYSKGGNRTLR